MKLGLHQRSPHGPTSLGPPKQRDDAVPAPTSHAAVNPDGDLVLQRPERAVDLAQDSPVLFGGPDDPSSDGSERCISESVPTSRRPHAPLCRRYLECAGAASG